MRLRNAQFAIPWKQFHDDEYHNFGLGAVPTNRIVASPTNYALTIPYNPPIIDGFNHPNPERYPNDPDSNGNHVGANEPFPSPTGSGIDRHHMRRTIPLNNDSGAGQFDFLVVKANDPQKQKLGYKIFCAWVCNGARDYGEVFDHGIFLSPNDYSNEYPYLPVLFVRPLVQGGGAQKIINEFRDALNDDITQANH